LRRAWFENEGDVRGRTITGERVINLEEGEEREKEGGTDACWHK
jgi:hypothetical protein